MDSKDGLFGDSNRNTEQKPSEEDKKHDGWCIGHYDANDSSCGICEIFAECRAMSEAMKD